MSQEFNLTPAGGKNENPAVIKTNDHEVVYELQSLVEGLPEEKQKVFHALLLQVEKTSWKGPVPPPDILCAYNEALSDGAERILQMAEKHAIHKIELEKQKIENQRESKWGQIFAFLIAMSFLLAAAFLIWHGHDTAGTILGS